MGVGVRARFRDPVRVNILAALASNLLGSPLFSRFCLTRIACLMGQPRSAVGRRGADINSIDVPPVSPGAVVKGLGDF